jgi:hypothetical protein
MLDQSVTERSAIADMALLIVLVEPVRLVRHREVPMTVTTHPPNTSPHVAAGAAQPPGWLARLAGWSYDHRRRVLVMWIGLLVVASVASGMVGNAYQDRFTGNAESQQAQDLLKAKFPAFAGDTADVVVRSDSAVTSRRTRPRSPRSSTS